MKKVISASRRTDLVAFFPDWLAGVIRAEKAEVLGPSGRVGSVDLRPDSVHTFVLWSKNFAQPHRQPSGLRDAAPGNTASFISISRSPGWAGHPSNREVPPAAGALGSSSPLSRSPGSPGRVSLRFDPVIYWKERGGIKTNLGFFDGTRRTRPRGWASGTSGSASPNGTASPGAGRRSGVSLTWTRPHEEKRGRRLLSRRYRPDHAG